MAAGMERVGAFLAGLPDQAEPDTVAPIVLDALLLRGPPGAVRLIAGGLCLDVAADDVLAIEQTDTTVPSDSLAAPVQVTLVAGVRLLDITSAVLYAGLFGKPPTPFAYATRSDPPPGHDSPRFRILEAAFRRKHGLE